MDAALSFSEQLYHQISRQANDVTDPDVETHVPQHRRLVTLGGWQQWQTIASSQFSVSLSFLYLWSNLFRLEADPPRTFRARPFSMTIFRRARTRRMS